MGERWNWGQASLGYRGTLVLPQKVGSRHVTWNSPGDPWSLPLCLPVPGISDSHISLPLRDFLPLHGALQTPAFLFYPSNLVWCLQTVGRTGSAGKVQGTWGLWLTLVLCSHGCSRQPLLISQLQHLGSVDLSSLQMTEEAWVLASNSLQS